MSSLKIEERFTVHAPVERVWEYLLSPEKIVVCLPGAELLEVENDHTYHGQMKVKVGPVTVAYKGTIEVTESDAAARRLQMAGKGKETGGAGTAKMTMVNQLNPVDGGTEVEVTADVQLAGRIVRFGRGMIQGVSDQLFKQFVDSLRDLIERSPDDGQAPGGDSPGEPDASSHAASALSDESSNRLSENPAEDVIPDTPSGNVEPVAVGDQTEVPTTIADPLQGTQDDRGDDGAGGNPGSSALSASARVGKHESESSALSPQSRHVATREAEPIRIVPLLFRALWSSLRRFFGRLFGRGAA